MRLMKLKTMLVLISAVFLSGCSKCEISGNFCDLYEPTGVMENGLPNINDAVYECMCLGSDADWCD